MKVLIIDNFDSFTHNLAQLIEKTVGPNYCIIKNDREKINLDEYEKIIFSPGPGIPKEEAGLMHHILTNYQQTKRILGICLGHQAIAEFYGAKLINLTNVYHGIQSNINVIDPPDSLFKNLPLSIKGGLYHSWGVCNSNFPECLKINAISADGIIMGVSHKIYDIKGLQFHPESIMTDYGEMIIRNWLSK